MSSTKKTLALLSYFTANRPEIGLSQLCRIAGRDKATTYRHLQTLEDAGFVEQNPATKHYRLGPVVLQLAQTRELTVPRKTGVEAPLAKLAQMTGETSHATVLSGTTVYALASCESPQHGTRAIVDLTTFPLHATASGLCALAFGPQTLCDIAAQNIERFTDATVTSASDLTGYIADIRATGFGRANRTYETEIQGHAAPVFDHSGLFAGAVAVASVAARFDAALERTIHENLVIASREITHNWGGKIPPHIEAIWAETLARLQTLDIAS